MASQNIEFSKEGIKFSYRRFLCDGAAGYLVMLFFLFAYYYPIFGQPLQYFAPSRSPIPQEAKVFLLLIAFLLSTPLGLAINAASWFFLGWCIKRLEKWWFSEGRWIKQWVIANTKIEQGFPDSLEFFGID